MKKTDQALVDDSQGFDYSLLIDEPIEVEWLPSSKVKEGEGLKMTINIGIVTEDFLKYTARSVSDTFEALVELQQRQIEEPKNRAQRRALSSATSKRKQLEEEREARKKIKAQIQTLEDRAADIRYMAQVLGGVPGDDNPSERIIVSWNMMLKGEPVRPTYEFLSTRPFNMLKALYEFCCFEAATPKKKTAPKSART